MDCFVLFSYAPHDMYQLTITRYSPGVSFSSFDGLVGTLSYYSYPSVRVLRRQYWCVVIVHTLKDVLPIEAGSPTSPFFVSIKSRI